MQNSSKSTREQVRKFFGGRCGYCGTSDRGSEHSFAVDRFRPKAKFPELSNVFDNLVYSCSVCDASKASSWPSPEMAEAKLLNPRTDDYSSHIESFDSGELRGKTAAGAYTVNILRLNRAALVDYRKARRRQLTRLMELSEALASLPGGTGESGSLREKVEELLDEYRVEYGITASPSIEAKATEEELPRIQAVDWATVAKELTPYLMTYLSHNPERLAQLDPYVFEQLIGEYFASIGHHVRLVGRNPRTAADIMSVEKRDAVGVEIRYLIEVKRHRGRIGIEEIDRVLGAMCREKPRLGWHIGLVVSASGFKDFKATDSGQLRMLGIELKDGTDVANYLRGYKPRPDGGLWLPPHWDQDLP